MDDAYWMRRVLRLAEKGRGRTSPNPMVGAILVKDSKVVGEGYHAKAGEAHAEIVAIRQACQRLKTFQLEDCDLYTSCEPCPMCLSAIYWARLRNVFYGNTRKDAARIAFDDDFIYREVALPIGKRKRKLRQVLHRQALAAFTEWERKADKVPY